MKIVLQVKNKIELSGKGRDLLEKANENFEKMIEK
jgi:hypothetical protein